MPRTQIGIVGAGLAVFDLHVPALAALDRLSDIKYVSSRTLDSATAGAKRLRSAGAINAAAAEFDEMLSDPEVGIILVAVPIAHTAAYCASAIAAGKNVLAEKPIAETVSTGQSLLTAAEDNKVAILAGENFRFQTAYARMRELAEEGIIGNVKVVYWNDLHFTPADGKYAKTNWRVQGEHDGGYLIDGGTHIVAGFRQLRNVPIRTVYGVSSTSQHYLSSQPDTLIMNFTYSDGAAGHLSLGYGLFDPEARHPKICGDRGTLILRKNTISLVDERGERVIVETDSDPGFRAEWHLILKADGDPAARSEVHRLTSESLEDLRLIEAGRKSASLGEVVKIH